MSSLLLLAIQHQTLLVLACLAGAVELVATIGDIAATRRKD